MESKQTDRSPSTWTAKIRSQDGEEVEMLPDIAIREQLRNRIDKAIQTAEDAYGPKAKALVEQYLRPHAFKATSEFKDYTFGLKVDKGKADLSTSLDILGKQAADPHNLMREDSMQRGLDLIDNAKINGLLPPKLILTRCTLLAKRLRLRRKPRSQNLILQLKFTCAPRLIHVRQINNYAT